MTYQKLARYRVMKKIRFTKIDNGYGAKADYKSSNGLLIEGDNYVEKGFQTLNEAKEYCLRRA
jgi:hypothetical protein